MNTQNHPSFTDDLRESDRAAAQWNRILEKSASIVIVRGKSTTLAAQTVRIELDDSSRATEVKGDGGGMSGTQAGVVFGVYGHSKIANTDIQRDDRFVYNGAQYRVISIIRTIGQVQAAIEALS
ncbi:MAG: hypothetical protein JNJ61_10780 [Anaerolineae bacterium]|nr:hypothetical protein [Anaerolineae bacterium]